MFSRRISTELARWAESPGRKPLILRGARQVGKTVAARMFGERFDQFIEINLDAPGEADIFQRNLSVQNIFQAILLEKRAARDGGSILLFLDEIQSCPEAVESLRYFYETMPEIHIIAAGSLLEIALHQKNISFPVGRVEHMFLYPLTFTEFLIAFNAEQAVEAFQTIPFPAYAHKGMLDYFHRYALIGGMPEVVDRYRASEDVTTLNTTYDSLLLSYIDDASKYARNTTMATILRHCIETAPLAAAQRISFAGFGNSNYRSREVGEALRTLQRAMLIYLLYPTTSVEIPMMPDLKKSPRLQFLDTGLLNYCAGLQDNYFHYDNLHAFYKGRLAEHIVGQELLAIDCSTHPKQTFWVREKSQSSAEIDFLVKHKGYSIPVEVKAGATGRLRSLHQFMDNCPHEYAVRLYAGPLEKQAATTPSGKKFTLLNLPYFLASQIHPYLD
ncbi:MAG: ATP-binding protein, partial [Deltaproteobacteria bacterium]|nr:ATP-binding protein [Deltaproteobacteria bacterium]